MNREEKLVAIYKEMANKELTFGCLVKTSEDKIEMICSGLVNEGTSFATIPYPEGRWCGFTTIYNLRDSEWINLDSKRTIKEIIGHPVMIGDVLDYISKIKFDIKKTSYKLGFSFDDRDTDESKLFLIQEHYYSTLPIRRLNLRKPIEYQSDECIDYVYSLTQKD